MTHINSYGTLTYTRSPNLGQKTRPYNNQPKKKKKKKERICKIVDFAAPGDHRKLKECETKDKYLDLARDLKKLWNMKVTIIPIVFGAVVTVTKRLFKRLEDLEVWGRKENSKLQHCWEWPEYLEESWLLEETCSYSNSSEKPSAKTDVKNSQWVNNKIGIITYTLLDN